MIANSGNSFSRYYDEILRAEGLNEFTATDITNVTPSLLAEYDVAILGDGPLSVTQAQTLSNWVEAGGNLVAMRPDAKLAGLLGISSAGGTLGNAYLKVDTSTTPGAGIVGDTIQFHGTADRYTTAGAQTVATLYSDASTSTSNPAVTLREVGENGGHAAAFTYDLAKSVVYTRQGNPAWNEDERDGISPVRSDDLFYGAKEGDEQPDWVDSEKIQIPQADEQQRLLTNLVEQMNVDRKPLPRFWFLPDDYKAAVVMTGDDHANNGTTGRFEHFESLDSPGCVVAEWQCVRSTSYIYPNTPISDAKAAGFVANGFEVALHTTNGCRNWDNQEDLEGTYSDLLAEFAADFPSLPAPTTNRMHCIVWSDWASQPKVELKDGIRLDTTYYYWPAKWVQNRPGLFTGSGMPMRFADLDGSLIDVYQAATQMTDESEQTYPFNAEVLLDNALGSKGYYGTFVANMHTDKVESPEADAIVAAAQARGVPVISARQLLTWLDNRNQSSFGSIEWSGNHLSFTISPAAGADGLRAMVPVESAIGALDAIEREGTPVATTTRTIKGVEYAFFDATAGSYTASYIDEQLPEISNVQVQAENDGTATVTWDTSEPASSRVDYGTSSGSLPFSQSDPEPVTSHSVQISGLEPNATYYFRVTSADGEANSVTEPEPLLSPGAFSTPPAAPVLSATVPASPANQNSPKLVGSAAAGTTVAVHTGADCSGSPVATGTAAQLEAGIEVTVGDDSSTEFRATATGGGGTSACSSPLAYLEDSTAPLTQIESGPLAVANSDSASFSFSGEDPGGSGLAALECRIDSADPEAWSACTSPQAYTELSEGGHEFEVRAVDNAGNADASPAIFEWTVDTAPPALSIDSGPEGLTTDSTPTFAFSAEPGAATECSIDTGTPAFGPCSDAGSHTPEEFLADGSYTFRVRATDAASNQTVETRAFEVDATAPTTQIDLAPPALANSAKATFEFSGDDGGGSGSGVASFECKLDVGGFAACSSGIEYTGLAEGSHKFEVRAIDNAGNVDGTPASSEWTIDSLAPTTQITSQPPVFDNDASATFHFSGEDPGGSGVAFFQCRRDSAEPADWQPCVSPLKYTSLAQGLHKFEVRAVDNAGNADAGPAIYEWTIDTKAPETQIDLGPPALAASAAASFEFGGEDPEGSGVASFQCRRDSADPEAWSACTSPQSYSELSDGLHKFEVRAVDNAGNADASPASYEWTIDTTPPALSIDSGPEGLTTNPTPTFGFAYSPAPGDTLECSIDTGEAAYGPCSGANSHTPSEPLANGEYTFRVRATDEAGNEALASRDFATDATVPDTQITLEPLALVASAETSFEFGGSDPEGSGVASFQCRRDSADPEAWNACTSPLSYSGLAEGSHKFEVRAIDNAGNVDGSPASSEWSVDTVAPQTQIDVKPASLADSDEPSFEFSGSDPAGSGVGSFQCRRDSTEASAWEACASPHAYTELAQGPHKFEVRAIDKAGNVDQTPAAYEWTVDSVAPQTQIDKAPPTLSNSAKATFEFSGEDPGGSGVVSFQCRRDSDEPIGWQLCGSPLLYTSLAEGPHKFEVRAIDQAGNADQSPSTFEWTIDTKAPQTQITAKPAVLVDSETATFEFTGEDVLEGSGVASFECKLDSGGFSACTSGIEYSGLGEGTHSFEVRAIDQAGNVDGSPASYEWQIDLTPPSVSIDSGPEGLTNDNTPTFGFSSEPGASFECSIDAGAPAFGPCSSAGSHTPSEPLADGSYGFRVRATDAAGNQSSATRSFTVDATAPETQIGLKPAALVNSATATFQFSGEDTGGSGVASFECKLDSGGFSACTSGIEYTRPGRGNAQLRSARDRPGRKRGRLSPASYEWQIDLTPPSVSIDSGPEGLTNDPTPTFAFSSEPGAGFECSIDTGVPAFGPCSDAGSHTPAEPLADGSYTFRVRATDTAGNQATGTRDFEVDATVPPAPVLSATVPASPANHNTPKVLGTAQAGAMVRLYGAADCIGAPLATATAAELEAGVEVTVGDNSTTALSATATAPPENTSLCSASIVYVEDSSAPSTQIDAKPAALVKTDQATFQFSGEDPGGSGVASFECRLDAGSFAACASGIEYIELSEGSHSFEVRAIDQAGNVDGSPASYAWQIDLTPPSVSIDSGPATLTKDNTPTFSFSSEPGASFECSIDTGAPAFGPCSDAGSHTAAEPLADGSYTFRVRATDAAGNQAADTRSFTVDAAAPDTQIDAKPAALVNTDQATFQFSGEDPGGSGVAAFQCKLDEASFTACSSGIEYSELAEGSHSFEVRAIDNAGNLDGIPASYEWTVDTEAPDAQIANHPAAFSNSAVATFQFSGEDGAGSGVASFQCKLDEASFTACSSGIEYTGLSEGAHKFEVRAIDNAGNVDASPAAYEWSVDTIAPNTQIEANPAALVNSAKAKFEFSGEDPGGSGVASFQCKLDEASFTACSSGIEYTELAEGAHEFEVRAIDNAGNVDGTSASYEWSVDLTAPQATIDSLSKTLLKAGETSEVAWHGDQNGNFELGIGGVDCDSSSILDSGAYASAPSPVVSEVAAGQLAEGENTLRLCIADAAGNRGEAMATLIKDTIAPSTQIDSAPAALVNSAEAKFEFSGEDPGGSGVASYQCKLDEASFTACSSGIEYSELSEGAHEFEVRAIDNAGNVDAGPASHEWTVDTTPPAVSVDSGPEGLTNDPTPTFAFSSEPGAGFQCSVDTGTPAFGPCSDEGSDTPEAPLADGEYTFRVRATDAAGNQTTATRGFEVDATAPETQITLKPATLINAEQASFEFSGEDPGGSGVASFQCKLDEASFAACSSGIEYTELGEGAHEFEVRAIDGAGNVDGTPASYEWSVDTVAPSAQIDSGPAPLVAIATAEFEFSGEDPGGSGVASYQCKLDEASFAACSSGIELTELADGAHRFEVRAIDNAGNVDAGPASHEWTVDTTPPAVSVDSGPEGLTNDPTPTFTFSSEPGAGFQCSVDTGTPAFGPCSDEGSDTPEAPLADGEYTFRVRATDAASNQATATRGFEVDTALPQAPELEATVPPSPANDNTPQIVGSALAGTTVKLYIGADCSGIPIATITPAELETGVEATVGDDSTTAFRATATTAAENTSGCSEPIVYVEDSSAPTTQITTKPAALVNSAKAKFEFSGEDPGGSGVASFQCKLDEASFAACSSGIEYTELAEGAHEFEVRAIDNAGNVDTSPAAYEWSVDTVAPSTQITAKPAALVNSAAATFTFSGDDGAGSGVASFQCKLDEASFAACSSGIEYTELAEGSHSFEVRAIDNAGNVDAGPASHEWSVDTLAPSTALDSHPAAISSSADASFAFSADDSSGSGVASFQCRRDSGEAADWEPCSSAKAYKALAEGSHKFEVRAIDNAGNTDQSPAAFEWEVDTKAPNTQIDAKPASLVNSNTATFEFSGPDAEPSSGVASFQCKLDEASFAACSSGIEYTELAEGSHSFEVRAIDNAGNVDAGPASHEWSVDTLAPSTQITTKPAALVNSAKAKFEFSGEDPGGSGVASFQCKLDEASFAACSSGIEYTELAEGSHSFEVRAIDNAGNVDAGPASHEWSVDTTPPALSIDSGPEGLTNDPTPTFAFGSEPGAGFECSIDDGTPDFGPCSGAASHTPSGPLPDGPHTFRVRATDAATNQSVATRDFIVDTTAPAGPELTATDPASPANDNNPKLIGAAPPGTTIKLYSGADCSGSPIATKTAAELEAGIAVTVPDDSTTTFRATATTAAENTSGCSEPIVYVEDSSAPSTQITAKPAALVNSAAATFTFSGDDGAGSGVASFQCKLDEASFAACSSGIEYTELAEGSHSFEVRAIDNAGNVDAGPASHEWSVDTLAPSTALDSHPAAISSSADASFAFSADDSSGSGVASFQCRRDSGEAADWEPCSSAKAYKALAEGSHKFEVRAIDNAGNTDQSPAAFEWEVDTKAPNTQIDAKPASLVNSNTATFEFSGPDAEPSSGVASFQCKLDEASFAACSSGIEYTELAEGSHSFEVRAIDNAGNVDAGPASHEWSVDTLAPSTQITTKPAALVNSAKAKFEFSGEDPGGSGVASFQCKLDEASFAACSSGIEYTELAEGSHSFEVRAIDNAGNVDAGPASHEWSVDTTPPALSIDSGPEGLTNDPTPTFAFGSEPGAGFECSIDDGTPDFGPCSGAASHTPSGPLPDGPHTFRVRATDAATNQSVATRDFIVDTTAPAGPELTATDPASPANDNNPKLIGAAPPGTTIKLYSGADCSGSPIATKTAAELEAGIAVTVPDDSTTTFRATATTAAENTSGCSEPIVYVEDSSAPSTQITAKPAALVNSAAATFTFSGDDGAGSGVASFQCKLDEASFAACSSGIEYTELAEGSHSFEVRAIDNAGNVDAGPASHEWSVDTLAPSTALDSHPAAISSSADASFAFSADDSSGSGVASFQCRRDSGEAADWEPCSSAKAYKALAEGSHKFEVRAIDNAGNTDQSPAAFEWEVDTKAPNTQIDAKPASLVNSNTATFEFSGPDAEPSSGVASFQCKLDEASFAACSSGIEYTELAEGSHSFEVRAIDNAGNVDAGPASHEWSVNTLAPSTQITTKPAALVNSAKAKFEFSGEDPGGSGVASFQCKLDEASFAACSSGIEYTELAEGSHSFEVRAIDNAGNVDAGPASHEWSVDTTPPALSIDSGPEGLTNDPTPTFAFGSEPGAGFECSIDDGTPDFGPCSGAASHTPSGPLPDGPHTFRVRATDAATNQSVATRDFIVDTTAPAGPELTATDPASPANDNNPKLIGAAPPGTTIKLYSGADCSGSPIATKTAAELEAGIAVTVPDDSTTTFRATATTAAENTSGCSEPIVYVEDSSAPSTQITAKPAALVNSAAATFTFSGDDGAGSGVASFQCRNDAGAWSPCNSPQEYTGLSEGGHEFEVRAIDQAGNTDATPATFAWNVDTVAPETSLDSHPAALTNSAAAKFTFSGDDSAGSGVASFECRRDGGAWSICASPREYSGLAEGAHEFQVRAIDNAANADASPAAFAWTVDTAAADAPELTATDPASPANDNNPKLIGAAPPGTTIKLYSGADCSGSPIATKTAAELEAGIAVTVPDDSTTTFRATATTAAENTSGCSGPLTYVEDSSAPDTTIGSHPPAAADGPTAEFAFSGSDGSGSGVASFECRLDGGSWTACASPAQFAALADGAHVFDARAIDNAGNVDPSPATFAWAIDTSPPEQPQEEPHAETQTQPQAQGSPSGKEPSLALKEPAELLRVLRNKKNGTALLVFKLPGPGLLSARPPEISLGRTSKQRTTAERIHDLRLRQRRILPRSIRIREAGLAKLPITLTKSGKKLLRKSHRLKVRVVARYRSTDGSKATWKIPVTLTKRSARILSETRQKKHP